MSNEWSQPDSPPAPLFTGKKERDLVKQVNDELIEKVIGQAVVYYPIDVDRTNFHDLYGEAIIKTFLPTPLSKEELSDAIDDVIKEVGAKSIKQMGKVMEMLKQKFAGRMDFAESSQYVKKRLE